MTETEAKIKKILVIGKKKSGKTTLIDQLVPDSKERKRFFLEDDDEKKEYEIIEVPGFKIDNNDKNCVKKTIENISKEYNKIRNELIQIFFMFDERPSIREFRIYERLASDVFNGDEEIYKFIVIILNKYDLEKKINKEVKKKELKNIQKQIENGIESEENLSFNRIFIMDSDSFLEDLREHLIDGCVNIYEPKSSRKEEIVTIQESFSSVEVVEYNMEIKEEIKLHLEKYKEMMEGAVSDCQVVVSSIISKEDNKVKKEKYQKIQEKYEAKIEQVKKTINSWK